LVHFFFPTVSILRIIGGSARGTRLSTFSGLDVRPTPDRVREAVFSILFSRMGRFEDKKILDLYAGSGAMALEALSRGAATATLVERDPKAIRLIETNARTCRLSDSVHIMRADVGRALRRMDDAPPFDLIFLDPPYGRGLAACALELIDQQGLLAQNGIVCAECGRKEDIPQQSGALSLVDSRRYGLTAVHFFVHTGQGEG
jgi:16S rRNA (guanine(966)-N(2))-methyltransferase RsmD